MCSNPDLCNKAGRRPKFRSRFGRVADFRCALDERQRSAGTGHRSTATCVSEVGETAFAKLLVCYILRREGGRVGIEALLLSNSLSHQLKQEKPLVKQKRTNSWWEPVFKKGPDVLPECDWNFDHDTGKNEVTLTAEKLDENYIEVKHKKFVCCDFTGDFKRHTVKFTGCEFEQCDFGKSEWNRAKFRSCKFQETSFSISTFSDCEFRDCKYQDILYSGNTTKIDGTLITNPRDFLLNTQSFVDHLPGGTSAAFQRANLRETQSTFARIVLDNLRKEGSESTYYEAIRSATLLSSRSRHIPTLMQIYGKRRKLDRSHISFWNLVLGAWVALLFASGLIERQVLRCLGFLNAWGASIVRPMIFGIVLCLAFAKAYHSTENLGPLPSLLKSCEILLLFGYTNYTSAALEVGRAQLVPFLNAISGLLWYAVTIPTIVNKLTRLRG